ncbi:MAG TPA: TraB/GumN family protein, partial [Kofleriaceae bacterium]|nr:TraB/GumN family protein [Kofleriaceae bacterium]
MVRVALVMAMVACAAPKPKTEPAKPSLAQLFREPTIDPWRLDRAAPAPISHEPGMIANHLRAEKACPKVTAPYFYSVEKAGKKSVILGTRHIGVGLAKMPSVVTDRLSAAKLAVLETPPDNDEPPPDKPGPSLADAVGADQWRHFEELIGHDAAEVAEHAKPSVAIAGMTGIYEDVTQTLDVEIEQFAQAHSIPIQGLETNAFQDK